MPRNMSPSAPATYRTPAMDVGTLGPSMRALNPRQQAFVDYVVQNGTQPGQFTEAAAAVGYKLDDQRENVKHVAWKLTHNPKIQEAILEETKRRLGLGVAAVARAAMEVATDKTHKDFGKLSLAVLAMSGIAGVAKSQSEVTHRYEGGLLEQIKAECLAQGIDFGTFVRTGQMKDITPEPLQLEHEPVA